MATRRAFKEIETAARAYLRDHFPNSAPLVLRQIEEALYVSLRDHEGVAFRKHPH